MSSVAGGGSHLSATIQGLVAGSPSTAAGGTFLFEVFLDGDESFIAVGLQESNGLMLFDVQNDDGTTYAKIVPTARFRALNILPERLREKGKIVGFHKPKKT